VKYQRDILKDVEGYTPGEQLNVPDIIKLNTNENPYPPSPKVGEALSAITGDALRKYPDPLSVELRRACAERYGYDSGDWVMAGNGMDELLAMTIRTFVNPGETVLSVNPTYSLYEILVQLHGARYETVDLNPDGSLSDALFSAKGALCFVPRPNAPTGFCESRESMERFCEAFDGIVYIDEAYVDFADDSCMDFPKRFDNVIVGRTFSKAFGLAGMRIGVAVANPDIMAEFLKTKDSYNLSGAAQAAGIAAMQDYDYTMAQVAKIKVTRARMTDALRDLGFVIADSQSNFVLARWKDEASAKEIFQQLRERAILIRYFDTEGLRDALRISVGTDVEVDALLGALRDILNP
jgi:histidinol-phosphate aminotransferase